MVYASNEFFRPVSTGDQQDVRHQLHKLSANDPVAAANMARHVVAAGLLVTGARVEDRRAEEPTFVAGFILSREEGRIMMAATARLGITQVFLAFDVDDAAGSPLAIGVIRLEGEHVAVYPQCGIWAPANEGRAVLVPYGKGAPHCQFVARRGRPLARIEGWPHGDVEAGLRRGRNRVERLARSAELADAHIGSFRSVITTKKGGFDVAIDQLAA